MPLRDHFRPPLRDSRCWEEIHGGWPMVIVQQLGPLLPPQYTAGPRVHAGTRIEVDVGAFVSDPDAVSYEPPGTTGSWTPGQPTWLAETDLADFDVFEVRIHQASPQRRLVAAIELISPANKDRVAHRNQFVAKCLALLRDGVALVLVDVVTERTGNLYAHLLQWIGQSDPKLAASPPSTYAVACRWRPHGPGHWLEVWNQPVEPGRPLPCLPLWLSEDMAVPLDLEASYEQTCRDLRIP